MKWLKKIALSVIAIFAALVAFFARQAQKARKETEAHKGALNHVKESAERLQAAAKETANAEGEANEERKSLAETGDADLVHRANRLF